MSARQPFAAQVGVGSRAGSRAGTALALVCLCLAPTLLWGCQSDEPPLKQTSFPIAGLYSPGNLLGASDPTDTPTPGAGLGDRCVPAPSAAAVDAGAGQGVGTPGQLEVAFKTRSLEGRYAPRNCAAVWIETEDEKYVATIEISAALRRPGLIFWQDRACPEKTGPDVVTRATLPDHEKEHVSVWKGLDQNELPVPDGNYLLYVEVTESDKEPGEFLVFPFEKGPSMSGGVQAVDVEGPLLELTATWVPDDVGAAGGL